MDAKKVTLEYTGPPNQEWFDRDADKQVSLVPGRRYQIPEPLAAFWLEQNTGHWKRPEATKAKAAVKE
jgi:hypothetical protein